MKNPNKPGKIKQRKEVNIGVVIFLFVLIYLIINVYVPLSKTEISIYEVPVGRIYTKESFKGLAVREETVVKSDTGGFINYYFKEGDRIAKNEGIYSIGADISLYDRVTAGQSEVKLSSDEMTELKNDIDKIYARGNGYRDLKDAEDEILQNYRRKLDKKLVVKLNNVMAATGLKTEFKIVNSGCSGIISYYTDKYTDVNDSNFNNQMFDEAYKCDYIYTAEEIEADTDVYKVITSDDWKIIVRLTDDMYEKLKDKKKLTFTINSGRELTAPVSFVKCGDCYFAVLSMDHYVANYTTERFLNISFDTEEAEGLKIPVSALTYKDYYRIPREYFMSYKVDGNTETGLMIERTDGNTGEKTYGFFKTDIFLKDGNFYYVSADAINSGEYICTEDKRKHSMLYVFTVKLEGAYNINNGYAVFKRVERLETGGDYVLAKRNSVSGLAAYDHIALNSANVVEGAVIY